jgi:hypothetical protein
VLIKRATSRRPSAVDQDLRQTSASCGLHLRQPALLPDNRRAAPVELTTYVVRAVLLEIKSENDNDIHLVIGDPSDQHKSMITEIVDLNCSGAVTSPEEHDCGEHGIAL